MIVLLLTKADASTHLVTLYIYVIDWELQDIALIFTSLPIDNFFCLKFISVHSDVNNFVRKEPQGSFGSGRPENDDVLQFTGRFSINFQHAKAENNITLS